MPVTCPDCSSDSIDLVERIGDYARRLRCETCGHEWVRHSQAVAAKDQAARDDATRRKASKPRTQRTPRPR
jgi:transposase-like protein